MLDHPVVYWEAHGGPKWPKTAPKCPFMTQNVPLWPKMMLQRRAFMTENVPSWPKIYLHDPKWPINISQGHNTWLYDIFDPVEAFMTPMGLWKGPRVVQHDTISCNIPMGSVLGPFGVIQRHFGSWRAIFGQEGPFLVLFWAIIGPPWASEKGRWWSNMTCNHVIYPVEVF